MSLDEGQRVEYSKNIASALFVDFGFVVEDIPESDTKRADHDVTDGEDQYIVEVKEKLITDSKARVITMGDAEKPVRATREPHSRSNRLDGILKHGRKQLENTPSSDAAFKLIFLNSYGHGADMVFRRALFTFYGVRNLIPDRDDYDSVNCVYFDNSFAYSAPTVDGLILGEDDGFQICVNEFSPKHDAFLDSLMVERFGNAVYSSKKFEEDDDIYVLRSDISRKNENDVLAEIARLTGRTYRTMELNRYSF